MADLGQMVVRIVGDNSDLDRSIDQSRNKMQSFGESATRIGRGLTTSLTLPIIGIGAAFVKAASDAEETNSKFEAVFKAQSDEVRQWASDFSEAVGRSTTENLGFLAAIQDTLVPLGLQRDAAAAMSQSTVELATDLASFNNLPTEQVIRDIQSAMVGNTETIRKYGVVANQAEIIQEALNLGLIDTADQLDATSKAQAVYSLLVKGTADAQGDALRTAGSTANQFRALKAEVIDLAIAFGNELLPFVNNMVDGARGLVEWFTELDDGTKRVILTVGGLAAALGPLSLAIGGLSRSLAVLTANPIILGLAAIATGVVVLAEKIRSSRAEMRDYNEVVNNTSAAILGLDLAQQQQRRNQLAADALGARTEQLAALRELREATLEQAEAQQLLDELIAEGARDDQIDFARRAVQSYDADIASLTDTIGVFTEREETLNAAIETIDESLEEARQSTINVNTSVEITSDGVEGLAGGIADLTGEVETNASAWQQWEEDTTGAAVSTWEVLAKVRIEQRARREEDNRQRAEEIAELNAARIAGMNEITEAESQANITSTAGFVAAVKARRAALGTETEAVQEFATTSAFQFREMERIRWESDLEASEIIRANREAEAEAERVAQENIRAYRMETFNSVVSLVESTGVFVSNWIDRNIADEEEAEKKKLKIARGIAIAKKAAEAFAAGVSGIRATIEALPNLPLAIATGAAAAAGVAAILATPIPSLDSGTASTPSTPTPSISDSASAATADSVSTGERYPDATRVDLTVNLDGQPILDYVGAAATDKRLIIDAGAVV